MRSTTAGELTVLAGLARQELLRVKVANGSGTMIDVSSWVEAYSIDGDKDQPVGGATVAFSRASGTTASFSPLRTDSTLNRLDDGVTYGPILDINRAITIELATTAIGATVVGTDYKLLFKGTIDIVNFEHSPVTVTCRDQGATIVDRKIEAPAWYGSGGGIAVETVMQSELDAVFGVSVIPLYTPVSPSYLISPQFQQQVMSEMDAQVALAQLPGFDVRYKWDDGTSAFRFTLSNPPRSKTTPDYTFGPSAYFDVTQLVIDKTNIKNVIIVNYPDSAGNRQTITVSDAPSIAKYERQTLIITEADTSPINTSGEATTLGNAALADLKDPKADQEVEMPLFWPGDLDDLYRFSANDVHYNTDQDLAVVQITHSGQKTSTGFRHRTHVKVRGSPIGQYSSWLARGGTIGGASRPPVALITPTNGETDSTAQLLTFDVVFGSGGGGTNITYNVFAKVDFTAETTLYTGNGTTLPLAVSIARHVRSDKIIRYVVTDAATGLTDTATWTIPSQAAAIDDTTGEVLPEQIKDGNLGTGVADSNGWVLNNKFDLTHHDLGDTSDGATRFAAVEANANNTESRTAAAVGGTQATKLAGIAAGATVGATWGTDLINQPTALAGINSTEGSKLSGIAAGADVTSANTAAAIASQGALATVSLVTPALSTSRNRCKTIRTANQSIADSAGTNINFNGSDLWDVGSLHDLVTNNDRLVVPTGGDTGVWALDATVWFAANATGRREVRIWQMPAGGGVGSISAEEVRPGLSDGGVGNTISIHATGEPAAVGDFWVVEVWQNSTAALNVTSAAFAATHSW